MSIGENLKRLRRDKGWTQSELANNCGIRLGQISKIERNETDPKLSTIYAITKALDCTPNALLMDVSKTSIDALMEIALERVQKLPDSDKEHLLAVIDKYCIAKSLQHLIENNTLFGVSIFEGKTEELIK
ncbi:helix-turn-helix domain-containing protein [Vibrio vulnificus]|uniref:helix-turn-helix domain-containing protein n=1 Tax=Vibrio vulnificus TaxID=672 RepID=UPI001889DD29|nr:helix-turn-helix transcriptional regulator [Vibrio vulnificus]MBF4453666.1 helix-turn-helix transcriptional regulator [Vibrio vulnificus]MBF4499487.1 helix-turn-helix transcriptional regulator [Vibrio vulnificus]MBL6178836.1 helix-turn-helix transcriptional regulator [Vibrio vulnificus]MBL6182113.1 helix-turn-helix transcriptional regulator [Vibrio vulnificus]MCG6285355.1 helix-turn-helix domain-containing protein [Vibrio vulnificus]